jgi:microsomal dipeptidase-like Zn-dependent dipeptidase
LINSQEDADFWASQGVAYITLVHLLDDENGASAITPGLMTRLMNLKGGLRKEKNRRLTEHGKKPSSTWPMRAS